MSQYWNHSRLQETNIYIDLEHNGAIVYNNANPPKQFVRVPGADHEGIPGALGENAYGTLIRDFILRSTPTQ